MYNLYNIYTDTHPYDYTVEVRNRFKGLDLIDRVPDELWTKVHDIVQETRIKTIPKRSNSSHQSTFCFLKLWSCFENVDRIVSHVEPWIPWCLLHCTEYSTNACAGVVTLHIWWSGSVGQEKVSSLYGALCIPWFTPALIWTMGLGGKANLTPGRTVCPFSHPSVLAFTIVFSHLGNHSLLHRRLQIIPSSVKLLGECSRSIEQERFFCVSPGKP